MRRQNMTSHNFEQRAHQPVWAGFANLLKSQRRQDMLLKVMVYILLIAGAICVMLPFFWMISTSLKKPGTEFTFPQFLYRRFDL